MLHLCTLTAARVSCLTPRLLFAVLGLHILTTTLFVSVLDGGYLAAGAAFTLTRVYYFSMQAGYIQYAGLAPRVWGRPSGAAFTQWGPFAKLAYPAAALRCMESFCYSALTVIAGALLSAGFSRLHT